MVGFERLIYTVGEGDGQVELCVNITVPRRQDIGTITFNITVETQNGSAGIIANKLIDFCRVSFANKYRYLCLLL